MSVGDAITCECNCADEEIKTVSLGMPRLSKLSNPVRAMLSSKARCEADHAEVAEWTGDLPGFRRLVRHPIPTTRSWIVEWMDH
jgi:hypothetical protein